MARLFSEILNNEIALFFAICIGIVFIVFAFGLLFEKTRPFARQAPGILTSLGILGTFYGIFIGLLDFDFNNIEDSIPLLLEGLKTAFSTSILGLSFALLFKFGYGFFATIFNSKSESNEENFSKAINNLTKTITENKKNEKKTITAIKKLTNSIVGDSEESLLGQIKFLRKDINKGFKTQKDAFDKFAEQVAQSGAEALIEALEKVIKDFNEKISEQFGENFKHLNEGVGKLLAWQESMKEAMERAVASISLSKESLEQSKNIMGEVQQSFAETRNAILQVQASLEKIESSTATIPEHAEKMGEMLKILGAQTSELTERLGAFAELREKAVEAIPFVEKNLQDISSGIQSSIQKMNKDWEKAMDTMHTSQEKQVEEMEKKFSEVMGAMGENLTNISSGIQSSIQQMREDWGKAMDTMHTSQEKQVEEMEKKFSEVMGAMGENLTNISSGIQSSIQQMGVDWEEAMKKMRTSQDSQVGVMETEFTKMLGGVSEGVSKTQVEMNIAIGDTIQTYTGNLSGMAERIAADYGVLLQTIRELMNLAATLRDNGER